MPLAESVFSNLKARLHVWIILGTCRIYVITRRHMGIPEETKGYTGGQGELGDSGY